MRVLKRNLPEMVLAVDTLDDLWHLSKVIEPGDALISKSERRFKSEAGKSERVPITIKIRADSVDFQKFSNKLRVLGTITAGKPEEYVSVGSHHTIELSPGDHFTLSKERWSKYQLDRVYDAVRAAAKTKVLIAVMDIDSCELAALREFGIEKKASFRGTQGKQFESDRTVFFREVAEALSNSEADTIVLAGPGFAKEDFVKYLVEHYPGVAKKVVTEDIAGYGETGIQEVLRTGALQKVLESARAVRETALIEGLLEDIAKDKGTYGLKQVEEALDYGAASLIIVSDEAFSKHRKEVETLLQKAEQTRCETHIVSSEHEAGKKLDSLGGVAARLRFKFA
jgi:protein pelota